MTSPDAAGPVTEGTTLAEAFLRPFMKLAAVQPGERVLDITPGAGEVAVEAALRTGETGEALAIDPRPEVLEAVSARARAAGVTSLRTAAMDPGRLELPDSYWDVVLCHFGLPELPDPEATLKEVSRVLRPVARLAASALGERERCPLVTVFLDALAGHIPAAQGEANRLFRFSTPGRLANLLAEQGFEDAVPDRLTEWIPFRDVDDYWQTMTTTTGYGRLASQLSADAVAACKTEIERRTRFYRRGGGMELKVEAIILAAVK